MSTDELIRRANERLNKTSNPSLPPEETLKAIVALGDEKYKLFFDNGRLGEQVTEYADKITDLTNAVTALKEETSTLKEQLEEQSWLATEMGNCLQKMAAHEYVGREPQVANRVMELNAVSLKKRMKNFFGHDTLESAKESYRTICAERAVPYSETGLLGWLFSES